MDEPDGARGAAWAGRACGVTGGGVTGGGVTGGVSGS
jgi:hypothetical protein